MNTPDETTFTTLASHIREGSAWAETQLVNHFHLRLVAYLMRHTHDRDLAQDLAQDTLIIVLNKLRGSALDDPRRLAAYVYRTAKFVHLGWLRKADNRHLPLDDADIYSNPSPSIEQQAIAADEVRQVYGDLKKLKMERDREIITRRFIRDETKREICAALSLSNEHFDRVLSRARKRLTSVTSYAVS